jgi:NAD(P)H dehydrogenase (quinone)
LSFDLLFMIISVILAHPDSNSFSHAIAAAVIGALHNNNHEVFSHDLYKERFPPELPAREIPSKAKLPPLVEEHCREIAAADGIIIIHPNWWGQPPAILKGWVDRVLRPGVAYAFLEGDNGEGVPHGLLKAKAALVFTTSNTPREREMSAFGDPLETIWQNCIFGLCGVNNFYRRNFGVIVTSTPEERAKWLAEATEITSRYFPY